LIKLFLTIDCNFKASYFQELFESIKAYGNVSIEQLDYLDINFQELPADANNAYRWLDNCVEFIQHF
jgi:hypothetical protein